MLSCHRKVQLFSDLPLESEYKKLEPQIRFVQLFLLAAEENQTKSIEENEYVKELIDLFIENYDNFHYCQYIFTIDNIRQSLFDFKLKLLFYCVEHKIKFNIYLYTNLFYSDHVPQDLPCSASLCVGIPSVENYCNKLNALIEPFKSKISPSLLASFIIHDDVDSIIQFSVDNPNYNICDKVPGIELFYSNFKSDQEPILFPNLCAIYGAVKCFKYFIMNDEGSYFYNLPLDVHEYALAGNNFEIIHILEQKNYSYDQCLNICVRYHHNDLCDWLLLNYECETISPSYCIRYKNIPAFLFFLLNGGKLSDLENNMDSIHMACSKDNLPFIIYLLDNYPNLLSSKGINNNSLLHTACAFGYSDIVEYLIEKKRVNINIVNNNGDTPLYTACQNNNSHTAEYLFEHGADLNTINTDGVTPLYVSIQNNNINLVDFLCKHGANKQFTAKDGENYLHISCSYGHEKIAKYLIEVQHFDINGLDSYNYTPLMYAVLNKYLGVVKYLCEKKAKINLINNDGFSALSLAAKSNSLEIVQYLCEHGAQINVPNYSIRSPLTTASYEGHIEVIKYLIQHGANIDFISKDGFTALSTAAHNGFIDPVIYLCEKEADKTIKTNQFGRNCLLLACEKGHIDIVDYLIEEYNMGLTSYDNNGNNAIHVATLCNQVNLLIYLLSKNYNETFTNSNSDTCLHLASTYGFLDIVMLLLSLPSSNIIINWRNNQQRTPLFCAALNNSFEVVQYLCQSGANINIPDKDGFTPVSIASSKNNYEVVKYLCELGAEKSIKEKNNGRNCLLLACQEGHLNIVKYLIEVQHMKFKNSDKEGNNMLHIATLYNRIELIKYFIEKGYDFNSTNNKGDTCLHLACKKGFIDIVKLLLSSKSIKININSTNNENETPLYVSIVNQNISILNYLCEQKADTEIPNKYGITPLIYAVFIEDIEMIKSLCLHGVNINKTDKDGNTSLHHAVNLSSIKIIRFLCQQKNIDLDIFNKDNCTPLNIALNNENGEICDILITSGASYFE